MRKRAAQTKKPARVRFAKSTTCWRVLTIRESRPARPTSSSPRSGPPETSLSAGELLRLARAKLDLAPFPVLQRVIRALMDELG